MVIAALLGLLLLLAVPLDVAFRVQGIEAFNGQIAIRWLFGLVRFRIRVPGSAKPQSAKPGTEPQAAKVRAKRDRRGGRGDVLVLLQQAAFRQRVYRLVKDLVRAAHLRQLGLRLRLGLGDPADTGRLWALVGPLNAAAQNLRHARVRIEPEFIDPVFEFEAQGRFLMVPLQILALAIAFAFSPPSIGAWRTLMRGHA